MIEQQVCSLQSAKRLKELGVIQNGYFNWRNYSLTAYGWCKEDWHISSDSYLDDLAFSINYSAGAPGEAKIYSAFMAAELGRMLPPQVTSIWKNEKVWECDFDDEHDDIHHFIRDENMANACAEMLIFLIENGLIKMEYINRVISTF